MPTRQLLLAVRLFAFLAGWRTARLAEDQLPLLTQSSRVFPSLSFSLRGMKSSPNRLGKMGQIPQDGGDCESSIQWEKNNVNWLPVRQKGSGRSHRGRHGSGQGQDLKIVSSRARIENESFL